MPDLQEQPARSLHFHLVGRWLPGEVRTRFIPSTRRETPESAESCERQWARMQADPNVQLFDGPMCRLEQFQVEPSPDTAGRLRLDFSVTGYKAFLGTNLYGPRDLPAETLANPTGCSPALQTSDGFLLFGRRNERVAYYPHRLHPFSGALEPPAQGQSLDVFSECRRELAEELNLVPAELAEVLVAGLIEDRQIRHPELVFLVRTSLPRAQVEARLDPAEHAAVVAVPAERSAIEGALAESLFTPVGMGALLLWGRSEFGEDWFERTAGV